MTSRLSADDAKRLRRGALVGVAIFGVMGIANALIFAWTLYGAQVFDEVRAVLVSIGIGVATAFGYVAGNARSGAPSFRGSRAVLVAGLTISTGLVLYLGCWAWSLAVLP
ncbi:hypothetical protein ACWPKO_30150 (plasmid) [Coraliomargarita sp. W4R53]